MKNKGSTAILVITVMILAVAMTMAGLALYLHSSDLLIVNRSDINPDISNGDLEKVAEIDRLIQDSYLKDYDRNEQMEAVYRSMLESLNDPYSRYLNPEELKQLQQDINSAFTGTGIVFIQDEKDRFVVTEVVTGGPAHVAGLREGDIILKADGKEYKTSEELLNALRGNPGTKVDVTIERDKDELEISIVRGDVRGVSVDSKTIDGENIGYIKIRSFGDETYSLFESALSGFENGKMDGVIIDLRDNPGGLFDEGVKVADRVLAECTVSYTVDRTGEKENYNSNDQKTALKMAVLINENTASTAEMVAAAIKVNKAGTLIGTRTYGKGLIQETHLYDDGSAVNITTKEFYPADGTKIDGAGVEPDLTISNIGGTTKDLQLESAIKIIKEK